MSNSTKLTLKHICYPQKIHTDSCLCRSCQESILEITPVANDAYSKEGSFNISCQECNFPNFIGITASQAQALLEIEKNKIESCIAAFVEIKKIEQNLHNDSGATRQFYNAINKKVVKEFNRRYKDHIFCEKEYSESNLFNIRMSERAMERRRTGKSEDTIQREISNRWVAHKIGVLGLLYECARDLLVKNVNDPPFKFSPEKKEEIWDSFTRWQRVQKFYAVQQKNLLEKGIFPEKKQPLFDYIEQNGSSTQNNHSSTPEPEAKAPTNAHEQEREKTFKENPILEQRRKAEMTREKLARRLLCSFSFIKQVEEDKRPISLLNYGKQIKEIFPELDLFELERYQDQYRKNFDDIKKHCLWRFREKLNITRGEFCEAIGMKKDSYLVGVEAGSNPINKKMAKKISEATGGALTVEDLLEDSKTSKREKKMQTNDETSKEEKENPPKDEHPVAWLMRQKEDGYELSATISLEQLKCIVLKKLLKEDQSDIEINVKGAIPFDSVKEALKIYLNK